MLQDRIYSVGATRFSVGLSLITKFGGAAYQSVVAFKILSGGGTLEIINSPATLGPGTGATGWGAGYPVGATEVVQINAATGPSYYYLAATGATMVVCAFIGQSAGVTGLI